MTNTLRRLTTTLSFTLAAAFTALPAMASVCGPSYSASYVAPSNTSYAPSYSASYSPSYAPAFSNDYSTPYGCPAYTTGQWAWNGYNWMWCPATTAYTTGGLGFFAQPAPNVDLSFGFGGYPYAQAYFDTPYASAYYTSPYSTSPYYASPYYMTNPYYVSNPFVTTTGTTIVNNRIVRTVRFRNDGDRDRQRIMQPFARHTFADRRTFVERRTFAEPRTFARQRTFVERRSFTQQHTFVQRRSFAQRPPTATRSFREGRRPPVM